MNKCTLRPIQCTIGLQAATLSNMLALRFSGEKQVQKANKKALRVNKISGIIVNKVRKADEEQLYLSVPS
jgi:hypothetical protein